MRCSADAGTTTLETESWSSGSSFAGNFATVEEPTVGEETLCERKQLGVVREGDLATIRGRGGEGALLG